MKQAMIFVWGGALASSIWVLALVPYDPQDATWPVFPAFFLVMSSVALGYLTVRYVLAHWND